MERDPVLVQTMVPYSADICVWKGQMNDLSFFFSGKKHFHQVEFPVVRRHRIYLRKRAIKLAELKEAQGVAKKVGIFKNQKNQPRGFFWCFVLYRKNV